MPRPLPRSPLRSGRSLSGKGDRAGLAVLVGMMGAASTSVGSPGSAANNSIANCPGLSGKVVHVQLRAKLAFHRGDADRRGKSPFNPSPVRRPSPR